MPTPGFQDIIRQIFSTLVVYPDILLVFENYLPAVIFLGLQPAFRTIDRDSYPGTHVSEDGRIYIVHDKGCYSDKEIMFHVIRPDDIVAGKLVCPDSRLMEAAAKGGGKILPREELSATFRQSLKDSGIVKK